MVPFSGTSFENPNRTGSKCGYKFYDGGVIRAGDGIKKYDFGKHGYVLISLNNDKICEISIQGKKSYKINSDKPIIRKVQQKEVAFCTTYLEMKLPT